MIERYGWGTKGYDRDLLNRCKNLSKFPPRSSLWSRTQGMWLDWIKWWTGEGIVVVRIPRGFSWMKRRRVAREGSAWAARRYMLGEFRVD